jgi:hypothetical protein
VGFAALNLGSINFSVRLLRMDLSVLTCNGRRRLGKFWVLVRLEITRHVWRFVVFRLSRRRIRGFRQRIRKDSKLWRTAV